MASCEAIRVLTPDAPSGTYTLLPRGAHPYSQSIIAFCDMSTAPAGQSLFDVPGVMALEGTKLCTWNRPNDDMDSSLMWADFSGRVKFDAREYTHDNRWFPFPRSAMTATSQPRAQTLWGDDDFLYRPNGVGTGAKPIPFPGSGVAGGTVVWLSNIGVKFRVNGVDFAWPYPANMPTTCVNTLQRVGGTFRNTNVLVTDGISSVAIGKRSGSTISCMSVLRIDWSAAEYTADMLSATAVTGTVVAPTNWHNTEEDAMGGDLLWTVKGKPCWLSERTLHLGTSLSAPFVPTESAPLGAGLVDTQHGIDFFLRVDISGVLWLGDWGHDNGGFFGCPSNDRDLGAQATTIRLAQLAPPPPPSPSPLAPPEAVEQSATVEGVNGSNASFGTNSFEDVVQELGGVLGDGGLSLEAWTAVWATCSVICGWMTCAICICIILCRAKRARYREKHPRAGRVAGHVAQQVGGAGDTEFGAIPAPPPAWSPPPPPPPRGYV